MSIKFIISLIIGCIIPVIPSGAQNLPLMSMDAQSPTHNASDRLKTAYKNTGTTHNADVPVSARHSESANAASHQQKDANNKNLETIIATYRKTLQKHPRERNPLRWAETQNKLGFVLVVLGQRERSTVNIEEAIVAHREALKEYRRESAPYEWAMTQIHLGNAFTALGERNSETTARKEAVTAYREALKVHIRERPQTLNLLGLALVRLGKQGGTAHLKEAVVAYREALKEVPRERFPFDWALTQNNLGIALADLGQRENSVARLQEAVAAFHGAIEAAEKANAPHSVEAWKQNLARAESLIAKFSSDKKK